MPTVFENILKNAQSKGVLQRSQKESIDWYRKNLRKTAVSPSRLIKEERESLVNSWTNTGPGRLYLVNYQPKHRATLPFYDKFPMMIPIERYKDGLLGVNLHYLPPILRAKLLDALYDTVNNDKFDEKTKMEVSYGILKSASKFKEFQPCIKRYLGNHFRSRFLKIHPKNWTAAVMLPTESFEKASKQTVWADSRKRIK